MMVALTRYADNDDGGNELSNVFTYDLSGDSSNQFKVTPRTLRDNQNET
jgi:hypothetical protein